MVFKVPGPAALPALGNISGSQTGALSSPDSGGLEWVLVICLSTSSQKLLVLLVRGGTWKPRAPGAFFLSSPFQRKEKDGRKRQIKLTDLGAGSSERMAQRLFYQFFFFTFLFM